MNKNMAASQSKVVYYSTDLNMAELAKNFKKRGWLEVPGYNGNWNFYWAGPQTCCKVFGMNFKYRMHNDQIINHFPNSVELSRKDLLIKNIKRYRKDLEREGDALAEKYSSDAQLGIGGTRYKHLNYIPMTFVMPADYNLFVAEFRRNPLSTWIMKPSGKSQGAGIFLVRNLKQLRRWAYEARTFYMPHFNRDAYVISKYIEDPLLIGGRKFDLRTYVLVTTFNPLKAYMFKEGFCRFCSEKYDSTLNNIENMFIHLTNVSIQKTNKEYNRNHGGKWTLKNFLLFLESTRGTEVKEQLFQSILDLTAHTMRAVAPVMSNDRHCFEVYGYDIIIDSNLKPWLVEVNSYPSLHGTTPNDRALKMRLIDNVMTVVLPPDGIPDALWDKTPSTEALINFIPLTKECTPKELLAKPTATPTTTTPPPLLTTLPATQKSPRMQQRLKKETETSDQNAESLATALPATTRSGIGALPKYKSMHTKTADSKMPKSPIASKHSSSTKRHNAPKATSTTYSNETMAKPTKSKQASCTSARKRTSKTLCLSGREKPTTYIFKSPSCAALSSSDSH